MNLVLEHKGVVQGRIIVYEKANRFAVRADMFNQGQGGGDCWTPATTYADQQPAIAAGITAIRRHITDCHHWNIEDPRFAKLTAWLESLLALVQQELF